MMYQNNSVYVNKTLIIPTYLLEFAIKITFKFKIQEKRSINQFIFA